MKINWQIKKLGEIAIINSGNSAPQKNSFFQNGTNPFFRTSDIGRIHIGKIDKSFDYLNEEGINGFKLFPKNTILLPKSGASTFLNHRVIMCTDGYVSSHLAAIKANENIIYDKYLFYFLITIDSKNLIQDSKYPSLKLSDIADIYINFPKALFEQQKIVKILDEVFEGVDNAKENTKKNLQNARDLFKSYLQNVFSNPGDGWEEKKLEGILQKTEIINPNQNPNKEFIYIDVSSVNNMSFTIESTMLLKGINAPSRARKLIKKGDIIFATVRPTLRRIAVIPKEYDGQICSTGYFVFRGKEQVNNKVLFYFLLTDSFNEKMKKLQKGASYPAVTDKEVKEQVISFPKSLLEQRVIADKLDALVEETKKLENIYKQKLANLEELKKSILKKAFNGEL